MSFAFLPSLIFHSLLFFLFFTTSPHIIIIIIIMRRGSSSPHTSHTTHKFFCCSCYCSVVTKTKKFYQTIDYHQYLSLSKITRRREEKKRTQRKRRKGNERKGRKGRSMIGGNISIRIWIVSLLFPLLVTVISSFAPPTTTRTSSPTTRLVVGRKRQQYQHQLLVGPSFIFSCPSSLSLSLVAKPSSLDGGGETTTVAATAAAEEEIPASSSISSDDEITAISVLNVEDAIDALQPLHDVEEAIETLEQLQQQQPMEEEEEKEDGATTNGNDIDNSTKEEEEVDEIEFLSSSEEEEEDEDSQPQQPQQQVVLQLETKEEKIQVLKDMVNFNREDIAGNIQAMIEEKKELADSDLDDIVGTITDFILSVVNDTKQQEAASATTAMASSTSEDGGPPRTNEEAAMSASLYMNPATAHIASNLIVSWEPAVAEIIDRMSRVCNPERPFMVGIVGIPGSGKSTSSEIVSTLLGGIINDVVNDNNDHHQEQQHDRAIVMPMDGFHLPLETLAELPNAAEMIYRRGAPDTFDPQALQKDLDRIAYGTEELVSIPGFDHSKGDPVPDQHIFDRTKHKIVICEGIYLLHDNDGWESIKSYFDWTLYIDADVDNCINRLKERNKVIPGYTPEEIETRCEIVDRNNAMMSRDSAKKYASQIVQSGAL